MCTLFERAENIKETSCHIRFWGFTSNNPLYASTTKRVPLGPARMPRGLPQVGSSSRVSRKINNRNRRPLQDSTCVQESLPYLPKQTPCCTEQKDHSIRNGPTPAAAHCKMFGMGAYCRCYHGVYLQNEHTIRCKSYCTTRGAHGPVLDGEAECRGYVCSGQGRLKRQIQSVSMGVHRHNTFWKGPRWNGRQYFSEDPKWLLFWFRMLMLLLFWNENASFL